MTTPLIPAEVLAQIPTLKHDDPDPTVFVKLVVPKLEQTIFVYFYNPQTGILDALVDGEFREHGSLSLSDLESTREESGIYRDENWKPIALSAVA